MRNQNILPLVVVAAFSLRPCARAGDEPNPPEARRETEAEVKARADYEASEKAAGEAEAALLPLRDAMQKADAAYASAAKVANEKRQRAADAKNLAGEQGAAELQQAEANLAAATKALADASDAKPGLDAALAEARAAALPLQQAYEAAEKAAREAETAATLAADAANKIDEEAKR
ncbi:MAG: hypothetical protein ACUVYA_19405, partial [Planctomycetota bacterium]